MNATQFKGASLAKILHSEFNVFQAVSTDGKIVVRLYEQKKGLPIGVKVMSTKVIHPLTEVNFKEIFHSLRNRDLIN